MISFHSLQITQVSAKINAEFVPGDVVQVFSTQKSDARKLFMAMLCLLEPHDGRILFHGTQIRKNKHCLNSQTQLIFEQNSFFQNINISKQIKIISKRWTNGVDLAPAAIHVFKLEKYASKKPILIPQNIQRCFELSRLVYCPSKIWLIEQADISLNHQERELLGNLVSSRASQDGIVFFTSESNFLNNLITKKIALG